MTYFIFTTRSTVGLGDMHPVSSSERIFGVLILLFGVLTTSFVMDNLSNMLNQVRMERKQYEESTGLSQFFGTMKRFNHDKSIPQVVQNKIENYFHFRWQNHINLAISTQSDREILA